MFSLELGLVCLEYLLNSTFIICIFHLFLLFVVCYVSTYMIYDFLIMQIFKKYVDMHDISEIKPFSSFNVLIQIVILKIWL